jgi:hypothetical protein
VPDDDAQIDAQYDEPEQDEPEAHVCTLRLTLPVPMGAALRSVKLIRTLHGMRIELERLVDHLRASSRLGHAGQSNGAADAETR